MILCGGDALIDFVPVTAPDGGEAFQPRVGGAVLNCATALSRLGEDTSFVGALSQDLFGDMLMGHMRREGIATDHVMRTKDDSTLAFVTLEGGEAKYAFYDNTSAGRLWSGADDLAQPALALHIGSVTLIADPSAGAYADLAKRLSGDMVISLDPNCRPSLISDATAYRARIKGIASHSHLIRFSDEDFAYLFPNQAEDTVAEALLSEGTHLVLISRGSDGASAYWAGGRMDVPARSFDLKDSIGAGDTFHAGVLAALSQSDHLSVEGLQRLDRDHLEDVLTFATAAAALNCETAGCSPDYLCNSS
jgi:fructokinase